MWEVKAQTLSLRVAQFIRIVARRMEMTIQVFQQNHAEYNNKMFSIILFNCSFLRDSETEDLVKHCYVNDI